MARIVCVTEALPGMLLASLEVCRRLRVRGHDVTHVSPASAKEAVEAAGLPFLELSRGLPEELRRLQQTGGWLGRMAARKRRVDAALGALDLDAFAAPLDGLRPDLVLLDGELHEEVVVALGCGLPVALLNTFPSIWRRPGLPPAHHFARPGLGWRGSRPGMAALWWQLRLRKALRAARLFVRDAGCDRLSLLRELARRHGVDLEAETDASQWLIPFTWRRLPVLSLHALEFEFPHEPPPHVTYVGPMVPSSRPRGTASDEAADVEAVLVRAQRGERRLVYAGFGSLFTTRRDLLERLVRALRPEWELLIGVGRGEVPAWAQHLGEGNDAVHVASWVPQLEVLQACDVVVTHGGINTLDEAVLSRTPVLVYAGGATDNAGNCARVLHHGVGIVGAPDDAPESIRAHLDRLLAGESFTGALESLARSYEGYAREQVLESAVDALLEGAAA